MSGSILNRLDRLAHTGAAASQNAAAAPQQQTPGGSVLRRADTLITTAREGARNTGSWAKRQAAIQTARDAAREQAAKAVEEAESAHRQRVSQLQASDAMERRGAFSTKDQAAAGEKAARDAALGLGLQYAARNPGTAAAGRLDDAVTRLTGRLGPNTQRRLREEDQKRIGELERQLGRTGGELDGEPAYPGSRVETKRKQSDLRSQLQTLKDRDWSAVRVEPELSDRERLARNQRRIARLEEQLGRTGGELDGEPAYPGSRVETKRKQSDIQEEIKRLRGENWTIRAEQDMDGTRRDALALLDTLNRRVERPQDFGGDPGRGIGQEKAAALERLAAMGYSRDDIRRLQEERSALQDREAALEMMRRSADQVKGNPLAAAGATLTTALLSPLKGLGLVESARSVLPSQLGGYQDPDRPTNLYSDWYGPANYTQAVRGQVGEDIAGSALFRGKTMPAWMGGGNWGKFLYDAGTSALDSAVNLAASSALYYPAAASSGLTGEAFQEALQKGVGRTMNFVMGSSAAAEATMEGIRKGYSNEKALSMGILSGLIEGITEEYSVEYILDKAISDKTAWKRLLKSFAAEGGEEWAGNWLNRLADAAFNGSRSEAVESYRARVREGMGKNAALAAVLVEMLGEDASSFLAGGLSGFAMSAVSEGTHAAYETRDRLETGKWLKGLDLSSVDVRAVVEEGLASRKDSDAYRFAAAAKKKLDRGGTLSDYELGRQLRANIEAIGTEEAVSELDTTAQEAVRDAEGPGGTRVYPGAENAAGGSVAAGLGQKENAPGVNTQDMQEGREDTPFFFGETDLDAAREGVWADHAQADPARNVRALSQTEQVQNRIREVNRAADTLGEAGSRALKAVYDAGAAMEIAPRDAVNAFTAAYDAALEGRQLNDQVLGAIPEQFVRAAYRAGNADRARAREAARAKTPGLDRSGSGWKQARGRYSSGQLHTLDWLGKAGGMTVRFAGELTDEEGRKANASYRDGVLTISLEAADPVLTAATHETVHRIREIDPIAYRSLAAFVQENMSDEAMEDALDFRARSYDAGELTEEAVADGFGRMQGNEETLRKFARTDRSAFQRIADALHDLVKRIGDFLQGRKDARLTENQIAEFRDLQGKLQEMEEVFQRALESAGEKAARAGEQKNTASEGGGTKYSILRDENNRPFVVIENDILSGIPESQWTNTVKGNLRKKFPDGVTVGKNTIHIDKQSRREMTWSRYTQWLKNNDPGVFADKYRATDNTDEILISARDWINEGPNHPRKDGIKDFSRGTVLLRIGPNDYTADVIVGTRYSGEMLLFDLVQMNPTKIVEKSQARQTANPSPGTGRNTVTDSNDSIPQTGEESKGKKSLDTRELLDQRQKNTASEGGGTKYSRSEHSAQKDVTAQYQKTVSSILTGKYNSRESVLMGYTPSILEELGTPSLPLVIGPGHVYSIAKTEAEAKAEGMYKKGINYHGLTEGVVKDLYEFLEHPYMVIASEDTSKKFPVRSMESVVVIVDVGAKGEELLMPVEITAQRNVNGTTMDVNVLSSSYEKNATGLIQKAIASENAGFPSIFYASNEAVVSRPDMGPIPKAAPGAAASGFILHQIGEKVNRKVLSQTQTLQFAKWFGDWQNDPANASKVVDKNGEPLVLYHQTENDFTVFDPRHGGAGTQDSETPSGIFLKPGKEDIGLKGKKQMALYANIRNPLTVQTREELSAWYSKNIPGYQEAAARIGEIDKRYQAEYEAAEERSDSWYKENYDAYTAGKISEEEAERHITGELDEILERWKKEEGAARKAAKKLLDDYFANSKYDGIHLVQDKGSFGRSVETYIAFKPEQVKSATDNIGTFDGKNPDIRYSLDTRELLDQVKRQKDVVRDLRERFEQGPAREQEAGADEKLAGVTARKVLRDYGSKHDAEALTIRLRELYTQMETRRDGSGKAFTWDDAYEQAAGIARDVLAASSVLRDELYTQYKDLRDHLRKTKIQVPRSLWADFDSEGGYNAFRQRNMGRLVLSSTDGTGIDQAYKDLASRYPEFFDEGRTVNPADQLLEIAGALDAIRPYHENPYSADMAEAVDYLAGDLLARYFDSAGGSRLERLRAEKNAKIELTRQEGIEKARKAADAVRKQRDEAFERYKAERQKAAKEQNLRMDASRLREKISRTASSLSQKLLKPTDKQHIPEELRAPVAAMLASVTRESGYELAYSRDANYRRVDPGSELGAELTKRTSCFRSLREQYEKIAAGQTDFTGVLDPELLDNLARVIEMKDVPISRMSRDQLVTVWNAVKGVEASVFSANKLFGQSRFLGVKELAEGVRDTASTRRTKGSWRGAAGWGDRLLNLDMLNAFTFLHQLGEGGDDMFHELQHARDHKTQILEKTVELVQEVVGDTDVGALEKKTHTFYVKGGELTLTTAQIMSLYELCNRAQAQDHIYKGGLRAAPIGNQLSRDKSAAENAAALLGKVEAPAAGVKVSPYDVSKILEVLTDEEIKLADGLQKIMQGYLADEGNRESMKVYGYRKFTEENYFPISTDPHQVQDKIGDVLEGGAKRPRSISEWGSAKATEIKAKNGLLLGDIFDVFAQHAVDMATYASHLGVMEDMNRVRNFTFRSGEGVRLGTMGDIIQRVTGQGGTAYLNKLLQDISGGTAKGGVTGLGKLTANYKAASVGANLRVVLQQPTAYLRALAVISGKYLFDLRVLKKGGWEKARKYAPIAVWKDWGNFEINQGRDLQNIMFGTDSRLEKIKNLAMAPAGMADSLTWGRIWNACELETLDLRPELEKGSDAFYEAVRQRFTDIIDQTQVVDNVLGRSQIMRSSDSLTKMATSYMGEPTQSYNLVYRAARDWFQEKDPVLRSGMLKTLGAAVAALAASQALNAVAQAIWDGVRDDDDRERKYWERFRAHILPNFLDNVNPLGMIPYFKDVWSTLQGYSVKRMDMDAITSFISACKSMDKAIKGEGRYTILGAGASLAAETGRIFGLPAATVKRDLVAIARSVGVETGDLWFQYQLEKALNRVGYSGNRGEFYDIAYTALSHGELELYQTIVEDMMRSDSNIKAATIEAAMRERQEKVLEGKIPYRALEQPARDLVWDLDKYSEEEESEGFQVKDLSPEAYRAYSSQKTTQYRELRNALEGAAPFRKLDGETKDKVLASVEKYVKETALEANSDGAYQVETGWVRDAAEAERKYKVSTAVYAYLHTVTGQMNSLEYKDAYRKKKEKTEPKYEYKDDDGEEKDTIKNSLALQKMEAVYDYPGLSEKQRKALFEYLGVAKEVRHYNKALVKQKLAEMRKQAK